MREEIQKKLKENLINKRILITGGLGMIGSTIANIGANFGANITIVDSYVEPFGANNYNIECIKDKVQINICDIRDKESIKILVRDKDIIFNLAGQISHNDSMKDPFLDADINYIGQMNVIENVKLFNPGAVMVFSGSRLQFGPIEFNPVDEKHPLNPQTPYAFHKTMTEYLYEYYHRLYGINTIVFRIANPYGIRCQMKHSKYSIVNYFIKQAMLNETIKIFGDGGQLRDYIYVEDLAEVMLLSSITKKAYGEIFNVGSGVGTNFKTMVDKIVSTIEGGKVEYVPWPENYINVETGDYVTNINKLNEVIGWEPTVNLQEGIERTYAYYLKHQAHYF